MKQPLAATDAVAWTITFIAMLRQQYATPQALGARVAEPIERVTGPSPIRNPLSNEKTGYPPRITVDIAERSVIVPSGWQSRM